jgi:hypothetical protein
VYSTTGTSVSAMSTAAIRTNVFVYASGVNSFPSAPSWRRRAGRRSRWWHGREHGRAHLAGAAVYHVERLLVGRASSRWRITFSEMMIPMSTMVPMAMAIPASATTLASTPNTFMPMNVRSTASGSMALTTSDVRRCMSMMMTTMIVTRICWSRASFSVPSVS